MPKSLVIIPTYNEIENISNVIDQVMKLKTEFHILVVDDNSPDGTAQLVEEFIANQKYSDRLFINNRTQKKGLGTAYIDGFRWGLSRNYDYLFEMDADLSHNPKDLVHLQNELINNCDVVIGSRYVSGVNVINWPMDRVLLSWCASKYVRWITRMDIHDTTAGFIGYRREVLAKIRLDKIQFIGYAFQIEMKYKAYVLGFDIKEIPVIFTDRSLGTSKMNQGIITEAIFGVLKLKLKHVLNRL